MTDIAVAVLGGDMRQVSLAELMSGGIVREVRTYAMENAPSGVIYKAPSLDSALDGADAVILPLPLCGENGLLNAVFSKESIAVEKIFEKVPHGARVLAGKVGEEKRKAAERLGIDITDYLEREELAVSNAVATAEGAIQIAMEELPITLHRSRALVTGFGRIGKVLAHRLRELGAEVTVCARKCSDRAWIDAYGYKACDYKYFPQLVENSDVVFNTVPSRLFGRAELEKARLVIDLASKPGGVELDTARELGVKVIWALSLPGKVAPITSARIICDTVMNIICGSV